MDASWEDTNEDYWDEIDPDSLETTQEELQQCWEQVSSSAEYEHYDQEESDEVFLPWISEFKMSRPELCVKRIYWDTDAREHSVLLDLDIEWNEPCN